MLVWRLNTRGWLFLLAKTFKNNPVSIESTRGNSLQVKEIRSRDLVTLES